MLFHLDAPKALPTPEGDKREIEEDERHHLARIRLARAEKTEDSVFDWKDQGLIFGDQPEGPNDWKISHGTPVRKPVEGDNTLVDWSGNAYEQDGKIFLYYTSRQHHEDPDQWQVQNINLATSDDDGVTWKRHGVISKPDARWYETDEAVPRWEGEDESPGLFKAWRDPEVPNDGPQWDPESGKYLMYLTARTRSDKAQELWQGETSLKPATGDRIYNGSIAIATSDSREGPFVAEKPALSPGLYAEMECPQVIQRDGKFFLFFKTFAKNYRPEWAEKVGAHTGLHCFTAESPRGPFKPMNGHGKVDLPDALYDARLFPDPNQDGEYLVTGWIPSDKLLGHTAQAATATAAAVPGPAGAIASEQTQQHAFHLAPKPFRVVFEGESVKIER